MLRATATKEFHKREVKCRISLTTWAEDAPKVHFRYRYPHADAETLREWSATATGRLGGPQTLRRWMELFEVFQAALDALVEEISGSVSMGQVEAYERENEGTHPMFEVNHRPKRKRLNAETEDA